MTERSKKFRRERRAWGRVRRAAWRLEQAERERHRAPAAVRHDIRPSADGGGKPRRARERTGRCLPAARLERLREQAVARTEQTGSAPWTDRLLELAACPPDGDTAGTVIA